jgi:hypothetical protein
MIKVKTFTNELKALHAMHKLHDWMIRSTDSYRKKAWKRSSLFQMPVRPVPATR